MHCSVFGIPTNWKLSKMTKMTQMPQNFPKWPQMTQNYPKWHEMTIIIQMIKNNTNDQKWHKWPKMTQMKQNYPKWPKWHKIIQNDPKQHKMTQNYPKWHKMTQNDPNIFWTIRFLTPLFSSVNHKSASDRAVPHSSRKIWIYRFDVDWHDWQAHPA